VSGPIADRIDLRVDIPRLDRDEMLESRSGGECSASVRTRVEAARARQHARGQRGPKIEGEPRSSSQVWIADWNGTPFKD
jgi:predicted ATPase with chaperone activity